MEEDEIPDIFNIDNVSFLGNFSAFWEFEYPDMELPVRSQAGLILLYTFTTVLAIVGNVLVLFVLGFGNRSRTDLSRYLINLAVADLCMAAFCIPFTFTKAMLGRWVFGVAMCPLVLFMQVLSVAVSIFTNTAIGIDRFMAVRFPLRQRLTKTRVHFVILIIWLLSIGLASTQLAVGRASRQFYAGEYFMTCSEQWRRPSDTVIFTMVLFLITYLLPVAALTFTYYKIGVLLWERRTPGNEDLSRGHNAMLTKRKVRQLRLQQVTKMLVTLVVVFALCWLPVHLFHIVIDLAPQVLDQIRTQRDERLYIGIFYICHWLAMANSFANPIIYCFLNDSFRADLKYLCRRAPCHSCLSSMAHCICPRDAKVVRHGSYLLASSSQGKHPPSKSSSSGKAAGSQEKRSSPRKIPLMLPGGGQEVLHVIADIPDIAQSDKMRRSAYVYQVKIDVRPGTV